ncbi:MAG: hypothetical protein MUF69_04155 [Desulfobacterota bacterium]|jgi:hypothetical protein|nr:hypothetical protein [Thermodesulfobacteriota bacterium]
MDKKRGRKACFLAAAIAMLVVAAAVPAGAGDANVNCNKQGLNRLITGDYHSMLSLSCTYTDQVGTFNPETLERSSIGNYSTATIQAVSSFDGRGGYTSLGEVLTVESGTSSFPVGQYKIECKDGKYEVDEQLNVNIKCDTIITPTAGYLHDHPPVPPGYPPFFFVVYGGESNGPALGTMGNIIILRHNTQPNVEELYAYGAFGNPLAKLGERICASSGMSMKIIGKGNNLRERGK